MAIAAAAVWEVRTAGDDTNGGAFVTGAAGVDYSQQDAKNTVGNNISTTDAVANGTTTLTSATASFTSDIVGNVIYLQGGTGGLAITRRQVTAFTNSTTVTVDANVATGTGITMNIGGALASPGESGRNATNTNMIWVKTGTYTVTSATANVTNGCLSGVASGATLYIQGYDATRGDLGTPPTMIASGITSFTLISPGATGNLVNFHLDGADLSTGRGAAISQGVAFKVTGEDFTNSFLNGALAWAVGCRATSCSTQPVFNNIKCHSCIAESNTITGFAGNDATYINCISANNSGGTTDGFTASVLIAAFNCVTYNNGRDGFRAASGANIIVNCVAEDNVGVGFNMSSLISTLINIAVFSNGTDVTSTHKASVNSGQVTYTSTAFTNAGAGDYSLNNTAGGGADLREAGFPTPSFPGGLTDNFLSIGAAQPQGSAPPAGGEFSFVF